MISLGCRGIVSSCTSDTRCRSRQWCACVVLALFPLVLLLGLPGVSAGDDGQSFTPPDHPQITANAGSLMNPATTGRAGSAPPDRQASIHKKAYELLARTVFRILTFDRKLDQRCKYGAVRVVIVRGTEEEPRREASGLARELEAYRGKKISGLPYEYQIIDHAPQNESYEVIFLPSGLPPGVVRDVLRRTSAAGVLCLTTDLSYIKSGAAVAILLGDDRPEIVIQKARAIEQGAEFDPRLYAYSTVIVD